MRAEFVVDRRNQNARSATHLPHGCADDPRMDEIERLWEGRLLAPVTPEELLEIAAFVAAK